jgi:SH3-like domain-containing protein
VAWDVAVLRDTPKAGAVVGRILRGTKVKLLARQGEWFKIRSGSIEGWAYRGALGM